VSGTGDTAGEKIDQGPAFMEVIVQREKIDLKQLMLRIDHLIKGKDGGCNSGAQPSWQTGTVSLRGNDIATNT
jgi:hypothetical protein